MRVLQVVEPGIDGVFRHVEGLVQYLISRGVEVHLAYSSRRSSDRLIELVGHVGRHGGRTLDLEVGNAPAPGDLRALMALRRLAQEIRPDIVHGHSSKAGALVRLLALTSPSWQCFYTPNAYYGMSGAKGPKTALFNLIERCLGRIGTSVNVSEDEARWARSFLSLPGTRQQVIPNAVDVDRFVPGDLGGKARARGQFSLPPDALVVGTAARMSRQKDPETLYRAFSGALKQVPNLWLLHLGRGELSEGLTRMASDLGFAGRVRQIPYLSDPRPFYHAIDVFALSSLYEGLSFAILEALSYGIPLVLTKVPGNTGFAALNLSHLEYAEAGSPASVASALTRMASRISSVPECNHREIAVAHFGPEACFGALLKAYRAAMNRRP
jgi:glycosyltransferase involved in cell wall biosynthesis